ncbi:glutamate racemase [Colwelliaceae bacterium 6441]
MKKLIQHSNVQQAIGVFDSGVGGLSIASSIIEQLPNERIIYVADSAHAPYGDISNQQIIQRVNTISDWLIDKNCKALVVACNTATVNAIDQLRERLTIPIIGVEPAIKPAAIQSQSKKVGILVTQATANNQRFLALVEKYKNGAQVFIQPCLGLVELIEQGQQTSAKFNQLLKEYLSPLIDNEVDTIVLGCTHYPFMTESIKKITPTNVNLINTAQPVSEQLKRQLFNHQLLWTGAIQTSHQFFSSNATEQQSKVFSALWGSEIKLQLFK